MNKQNLDKANAELNENPILIKCRSIIMEYLSTSEGKKVVIEHFKNTHLKNI